MRRCAAAENSVGVTGCRPVIISCGRRSPLEISAKLTRSRVTARRRWRNRVTNERVDSEARVFKEFNCKRLNSGRYRQRNWREIHSRLTYSRCAAVATVFVNSRLGRLYVLSRTIRVHYGHCVRFNVTYHIIIISKVSYTNSKHKQ